MVIILLNKPDSTTRSFTFTIYPSNVNVKPLTGFQEKPKLPFTDVSSFNSGIPAALAMVLVLSNERPHQLPAAERSQCIAEIDLCQ